MHRRITNHVLANIDNSNTHFFYKQLHFSISAWSQCGKYAVFQGVLPRKKALVHPRTVQRRRKIIVHRRIREQFALYYCPASRRKEQKMNFDLPRKENILSTLAECGRVRVRLRRVSCVLCVIVVVVDTSVFLRSVLITLLCMRFYAAEM